MAKDGGFKVEVRRQRDTEWVLASDAGAWSSIVRSLRSGNPARVFDDRSSAGLSGADADRAVDLLIGAGWFARTVDEATGEVTYSGSAFLPPPK